MKIILWNKPLEIGLCNKAPYGNKLVNLGHGKFKVTNRFTSQSTLIGEEISISGGLYEVKFAQVTPSIPHTCVNHGYWLSGPTNIN
ncbi:hypothetical protein RFH61_18090 [Acinetobacter baumannii]|uniref:hypothetical protein n=1 Tax=Acinetobacter baumannii TaxID=470 RepID=UPI000A353FC0|nr:hypothetical protein [Acinetobacter baumannii]MDQ8923786.1 hypothetical protein [Acinetobacter baumannii]MDQ8927194.1 hypothetical protein [Acinetobacter baumannii]MDQ8934110.1 hypothetical protein [Acinetobacter baumannii]MDX6037894.1 hypothetical protein [Acinetobacter baumannii]OTK65989.1 hypothetical protein B9X93_14575 [Acinetobacter baumannii]